ncbi:hypothetical protein [Streptomyces sp. B6B3]|uniref:hypothetical protein n=1 Tax=Streptomyces sp. B6B3 TaxID=3153570 RepID=UPI00325D3F15
MKSTRRVSRVLTVATTGAVLAFGMTANAAGTASAAEAKAPTPGFRACYDLNCNKRIEEGRSFNANGDHGITKVRITRVNKNGITVRVSGPNMSGECVGSPHVSCEINGLDITSSQRRGDTAVFSFWP